MLVFQSHNRAQWASARSSTTETAINNFNKLPYLPAFADVLPHTAFDPLIGARAVLGKRCGENRLAAENAERFATYDIGDAQAYCRHGKRTE